MFICCSPTKEVCIPNIFFGNFAKLHAPLHHKRQKNRCAHRDTHTVCLQHFLKQGITCDMKLRRYFDGGGGGGVSSSVVTIVKLVVDHAFECNHAYK